MENYNLSIKDLTKSFKMGGMIFGTNIVAVDHVNLDINSDKPWIMSIVGESGSGKSTLAKNGFEASGGGKRGNYPGR